MIRRNIFETEPTYDRCHDGEGIVRMASVYSKEAGDFETGIQFLHYTVLPPDTSIGLHKHGDDEEFYIVLEGEGEMETDGIKKPVVKGDAILNKPFSVHGIKNTSDSEELKLLVFEIK